jgi:hypothetical protein
MAALHFDAHDELDASAEKEGQPFSQQAPEKAGLRWPAPKGASDFEAWTVSLKRYPDTKP